MNADRHIEVERYFLSALLNSSDCGRFLKCGNWFHSESDQKIYDCIADVYSGGRIDIFAEAHKREIPFSTITEYMGLSETDPSKWIVALKDCYLDAEYHRLALETESMPGIDKYRKYESRMAELYDELMKPDDVDHYDMFVAGLESDAPRITMGSALDKMLIVSEGDLIVIGARPSIGKTAFMTTMAMRQSYHHKVDIFSYETEPKGIIRRIVANVASLTNSRMKQGKIRGEISDDEMKLIRAVVDKIKNNENLRIRECSHNVDDLCHEIRSTDADIIWIDYLQLIPGTRRGDRRVEIEDSSRKIQRAAKTSGKAIVCLAQLNRDCETNGRRPLKSDLREAGQIEQDADAILLLHVNTTDEGTGTYLTETEATGIDIPIEILIAKQRDGALGYKTMRFQRDYQRFYEQETYRTPSIDF